MQKRTLLIARLAVVLAATMVIQIAGLPQPITGPLINTVLFLTAAWFGIFAGIILGCLTPIAALIRGQLPPVLAPMVPFIAVGNAVLVLVFILISAKIKFHFKSFQVMKEYAGIFFAAVGKFLFLFLSVKFILPIVLNVKLSDKIAFLMTTPQLITAFIGGILALILIKLFDKANIFKNKNQR